MSTPNFYSKAGTVYALDFSDDDGEYDADVVIEDVTTAVIEDLKAAGLSVTTADDSDGERSYPGRIFAEVESKKSRDDVYCTAGLVIRSGYYADANLDYEIQVYDAGYSGEYCELGELDAEFVSEALEISIKKAAPIVKQLQRDAAELESKIIAAYTEYTQPLRRVAIFSNGEAIYESIGGKN